MKIVMAIKAFLENPFDGHTIEPFFGQMRNNGLQHLKEPTNKKPKLMKKLKEKILQIIFQLFFPKRFTVQLYVNAVFLWND